PHPSPQQRPQRSRVAGGRSARHGSGHGGRHDANQSEVGAAAGRDLENQWCSLSKSPSAGPSTSLLLISWRALWSGCFGVSVGKRRGSVMRRSPGRTTTLATASRSSCRRSPRPPGARKPSSCSAPSARIQLMI
uniref:Uncharacterized protein n=1 Tax=Triticum urartu TaxID=4572 RepID=A0A8R7TG59_TRIUA